MTRTLKPFGVRDPAESPARNLAAVNGYTFTANALRRADVSVKGIENWEIILRPNTSEAIAARPNPKSEGISDVGTVASCVLLLKSSEVWGISVK